MKRRKRIARYAYAVVDGRGVLLLHPLSHVIVDGIPVVQDACGETVPENTVKQWCLTAEDVLEGGNGA